LFIWIDFLFLKAYHVSLSSFDESFPYNFPLVPEPVILWTILIEFLF
jgi:hypothetical protein